jgi:hypothetical protein
MAREAQFLQARSARQVTIRGPANLGLSPDLWRQLGKPVYFYCVKIREYNSSPMLNDLLSFFHTLGTSFFDLLGRLLDLGLGHLGSRLLHGKRTAGSNESLTKSIGVNMRLPMVSQLMFRRN